MHPPLPEMFLAEIFANIEQLLVFNKHIVEEFSEIYRTSKVSSIVCRSTWKKTLSVLCQDHPLPL